MGDQNLRAPIYSLSTLETMLEMTFFYKPNNISHRWRMHYKKCKSLMIRIKAGIKELKS